MFRAFLDAFCTDSDREAGSWSINPIELWFRENG